ncbi:hypothetical protein SAMN04488543_2585 [Friedmanniella luteola]|uniref:Uncharacterized protein n=1 Tax=Friedmanniella luteola TaxID=546871 RepID=A0A1H1VVQ1_9ACTN|nr:DUF5682 family protein [Friedmanniella luteola]SDS88852.1 hypothetical protein SAMN04488543_2585 [Friedmanniella luteola]
MTASAVEPAAAPAPERAEAPAGPVEPQVEVYGIRHHGPGSARSLLTALEAFAPDVVLIEGPVDADPLLHFAAAAGTAPPVALLAYAADDPAVSAFWPFAVFSPEWQALRWALGAGVEVGMCDLPAAQVLAPQRADLFDAEPPEPATDGPGAEDGAGVAPGGGAPGPAVAVADPDAALDPRRWARADPLRALAEAAGYDDPERWWDDVVEARLDGSSPFPLLTEAMAELRREVGRPAGKDALREERREAHMRQTIRAAVKRGRRRVAVVCGAWHAPALTWPLPPAVADARVLRGAPKRKVTLTWVPWTHGHLATASGYGAGITSPGWYEHLWTAPDAPVVRWLTHVAHALRRHDLVVSSAHVIEAVRLAETLAALRLRPLAGLAEVQEATRAVLCDGDDRAARLVTADLVVGEALGAVDPAVPMVPLEADLVATCRRLRVRREPKARVLDLDLRRPVDQARSQLFHRLRLLGIDWVTPADSGVDSQGTFRETWSATWRPALAVALVRAAVWGTTVESAATARVHDRLEGGSLVELTRTVEHCLLAGLPDALQRLFTVLAERAALDADVVHLMEALPPLARAQRYGDVRRTDTGALRQVSEVLVLRICAGLPQAVGSLDDDSAARLRGLVDQVGAAVGLLAEAAASTEDVELLAGTGLRERWLGALATVVDRRDVHGLLLGRVVRLLVDADRLDDVPARVERALSHGVDAAAKAAWVEGFFADGALLLLHDAQLRDLLDGWVTSLDEREFTDLLPLVRRTFGTFTPAERRSLAGRLVARGGPAASSPVAVELDEELAHGALDTVDLILGGAR